MFCQIERFRIVPALHSNQTRCIGPQLLFRLHPQSPLRSSRQIRHRLRLDRVQVRSRRGQDRRGHCQSCLQPRKIFCSGEKSFVSRQFSPGFFWRGYLLTYPVGSGLKKHPSHRSECCHKLSLIKTVCLVF